MYIVLGGYLRILGAYPDLFACVCRTWISLDIARIYEEQRQPSIGSALPACPKNGRSGTHCWGRDEGIQHNLQSQNRCYSSTTFRTCRLETLTNTFY